ncbi:MAG: NUDIX domain-containing protein [Clostridiaceae bacterium]|nr:NUDIX domain-containing protein [Clostridiaceae bacterium]
MDITFKTPEGVFNYRVCAILIRNEKLLVMKDERSPYYYLPGGRVTLNETAEKAVLREIKEELEIDAKIVRPLWLNQSFFTEDVNHEKYHELCLYFLIDVSDTDLLSRENNFVLTENGTHNHIFSWMPFCELNKNYLYPEFIKKRIFNLPTNLEINTELSDEHNQSPI